jgi:hypothetical protein
MRPLLLFALVLVGCGSRSALLESSSADASCPPVPCPNGRHWDSTACACVLDRCANDADETVLAEITTDFAEGTALTVVDGQVYWTTRAGKFDDRALLAGGAPGSVAARRVGRQQLMSLILCWLYAAATSLRA